MLGETIKRLCKDAGIEGQITDNSPYQFAYSSALYTHEQLNKSWQRRARLACEARGRDALTLLLLSSKPILRKKKADCFAVYKQ